jgi:hypothetical protein
LLGTYSKPIRGKKLILATETLGSNGTRGRRKRRESAVGLSLLASCWSSAQLFSCYSGTPRAHLLRTHKEDPASIQAHDTQINIDHKHTQNDHTICWNKSNTSTMHRRYLNVLSVLDYAVCVQELCPTYAYSYGIPKHHTNVPLGFGHPPHPRTASTGQLASTWWIDQQRHALVANTERRLEKPSVS